MHAPGLTDGAFRRWEDEGPPRVARPVPPAGWSRLRGSLVHRAAPAPPSGGTHGRTRGFAQPRYDDVVDVRRVVAAFALAVVIAGCGSSSGSATPRASAGSTVAAPNDRAATATEIPASGAAGTGQAGAGQTETEWGRIWDAVPADFPRFEGATAAEEGATGPASATLVVPGATASAVASWMTERLADSGYTVDGGSAALEDGSFVLDARRDPGCRVGVTIAPTGGMTTVTVLYGAGCPQP